MHVDSIRAWIQAVENTSPLPCSVNEASLEKAERRFIDMPSKRQRMHKDDSHAFSDAEATPKQPQRPGATETTNSDVFQSSAPSFSLAERTSSTPSSALTSYGNILAHMPHMPAPGMSKDQRSPSSRSSASSRQRQSRQRQFPERAGSTSPSKRFRKMADLSTLSRPVLFEKVMDMKAMLPSDAHNLYDALVMAARGEEVIPAALADVAGVDRNDFRPYMWQPSAKSSEVLRSADRAGTAVKPWERTIPERYARILEIIEESNELGRWHRSEQAWNSQVYSPLLIELALSSWVRVENVTLAQIVSNFRPSFKSQELEHLPSTPTDSSFSETGSMVSIPESNAS
ncbi:hypothetical protein MRS44_017315 [Fusarium solani]|uniref:uncharacterized protein n=1 Tax=Fusarium solani TaxID=169388 RepID=UPI0032C44998|nr:hypothetical protein MRS44_017315 [Fusarium solani]